MLFNVLVIDLAFFELLAVHLAEEIEGPVDLVKVRFGVLVVDTVQECAVASLQESSLPSCVVVRHQIVAQR